MRNTLKIAFTSDKYKKCYLGNETFVISAIETPDTDQTVINFSIDQANNTFTVSLSNVSAHVQYLLENNRLGVCLVAGRTKMQSGKSYNRGGEIVTGHYVSRTYHPKENIRSDVFRLSDTASHTYNHQFAYYDCNTITYIFSLANHWQDPPRPNGWVSYKAMLCVLPRYSYASSSYIGLGDGGAGVRGFKKSTNAIILTYENTYS